VTGPPPLTRCKSAPVNDEAPARWGCRPNPVHLRSRAAGLAGQDAGVTHGRGRNRHEPVDQPGTVDARLEGRR
jgi:hypothetical protein